MKGLGTVINVALVIFGGLCGLTFGKFIKEKMRETVLTVNGIGVILIAIGGVLAKMLVFSEGKFSTQGEIMMIVSLALGSIIGELLNIEDGITKFGEWLKVKTKSTKDDSFVQGFLLSSCTICIGAMAIMGSIEDGMTGNYKILLAKGIIDAITICIMTASLGKGCIFSAIPVFLLQGVITVTAFFLGAFIPENSINNISYVGNAMILCVGFNLAFKTQIRVSNILPSLIIAGVWGAIA